MNEIGARIKAAREATGLSKAELGDLIGKSCRTVYRYESGDIELSVSVLKEIAKVLDVSLSYLLGLPRPLTHVMLIEFQRELGSYKIDEVALFNINRISEEEAMRHAASEEYNDNVLCIPKRQWVALFKDGKE